MKDHPTSQNRREDPAPAPAGVYGSQFENCEDPSMKVDLEQMWTEFLKEGIISLSPLPVKHFPADHDEYVGAANRDLAARPRRQRKVLPAST